MRLLREHLDRGIITSTTPPGDGEGDDEEDVPPNVNVDDENDVDDGPVFPDDDPAGVGTTGGLFLDGAADGGDPTAVIVPTGTVNPIHLHGHGHGHGNAGSMMAGVNIVNGEEEQDAMEVAGMMHATVLNEPIITTGTTTITTTTTTTTLLTDVDIDVDVVERDYEVVDDSEILGDGEGDGED